MNTDIPYTDEEREALRHCRLCPRKCGADRTKGETGFCNCTDEIGVSLVCNHNGEEPVISREKGICNVFFIHCNLQCIYCQNRQISRNGSRPELPYGSFDSLIARIKEVLSESENVLGFVSPTHHLPLMKAVIRTLNSEGLHPRIVYNTNAYDNVEELKKLEGMVDIYLPDLKYANSEPAARYSAAPDYFAAAAPAILEMYRQTGAPVYDENVKGQDKLLENCYVNSLKLAEENNLETVAFSAISTGAYGYPIDEACQIAFSAVAKTLPQLKRVRKVFFVCFNQKVFDAFKKAEKIFKNC